jgi:glycosyltransferase involved in cell wall biosynthesis
VLNETRPVATGGDARGILIAERVMPPHPSRVGFSHLRWNIVHQRPQHLLTRLAASRQVLYVEEPQTADTDPRWERSTTAPNVTVYRPMTPSPAPGFHPEQLAAIQPLLPELLAEAGPQPVAWVYTPLALPLVERLDPVAVVYDCMDELSLFLGAPPEVVAREDALLARADLVFTGGPSLYRAKRHRHRNIHCFPSSVDADHFGRARPRRPAGVRETEPSDQAGIPHPRLGFFGVLDERIDLAIVAGAADAHPEWQIVMVGPVVKIDPAMLPRRPNIHDLGSRPYAELPAYLAGWDVCLLPFARNEATRFISPTKTLEYMAAERPIVSTPITDVAEPYGDLVYLGSTPVEFVAACEAALGEEAGEHLRRVGRMREVLAGTSWDATAAHMERLVTEAVHRNRHAATPER